MRHELLVAREDVLCLGMGSSPFEAVYAKLHYLIGVQNGSRQVHALTGRIARGQVLLLEFDIVYVTQKAIKGSTLADYLA